MSNSTVSSKMPKTQVSRAVFAAMLTANPQYVVDSAFTNTGKAVSKEGRKDFFDRMGVALAEQGDTISKDCLSNYYARNKAAYEDGKSFYQHNLTTKQRAVKNADNTQVNVSAQEPAPAVELPAAE